MDELRAIAERLRDTTGPSRTGPWTLEIYPTMACNLSCRFCETGLRRSPPHGELALDEWLQVLRDAASLGTERVFVLGGGEPLAARDRTPALLFEIKRLGLEGVLGTNGTLFDDPLIAGMVEAGWDEIHFSMDAPTPALHDELRGASGAFRRTASALCRFRTRRNRLGQAVPRLVIHSVVMNANHRTLPDLVRLAAGLGADRIEFDALVAWTEEQRALLPDEDDKDRIRDDAARAEEEARRLGIATNVGYLCHPGSLERGRRALAPDDEALPGVGRDPCLRPWHYLVVQQDGRTSPCCVLAGIGDDLRGRSLAEVWTRGERLTSLRRSFQAGRPTDRCRECSENILSHEALLRRELTALHAERAR